MADNELVIKINGNIKGYKNALQAATKETEDLQQTLSTVAKVGAVAFSGFVASIGLAASKFAEFDHGLRGVKTLLDESSFSTKTLDEGFKDLSKGALKSLQNFPLTLQSLNKSLFDIVSAGVPASDAIGVLGSTSRLAVAGITESAIATDGVTSALNAYGLSAKESEIVAAKFFTAQKFGKTTIEELSSFFGRAASSAASYGVSLDELLAATAAMTTGGIKTAAALTALPMILSNVAKPTEDAKEEAERLGIAFDSTALRAQGLAGFLDTLTSAQGFNKQSIEKLFSSIEAQKAVFSLTGKQAGKFRETLDELSNSQKILTTFTRAYEEQSQSLKNQTIILKNNFDALGITIGANFAPTIKVLAGIMTNFLKFLQDNPGLADFISKMLIAGTVTTGLITTAGLAGLALLKLRAALAASTLATNGLKFAIKGLIGSTGIGLLVAFLPEIVQLFQWAFGKSTKTVEEEKRKQEKILKETNKTTEEEEKKHGEKVVDIQKKVTDSKLQKVKEENERIKASLDGLKKEEINFLKRRQEIQKKAAEAEKEQDKNRKAAALENVKLLNAQLEKEQNDFRAKEAKAQAEKDAKAAERLKKEREETAERIQNLKNQNEVIKASLAGQEKDEVDFLQRRQEIRDQIREAEKIKDQTERNLALENARLKNEQLLVDEKEFFTKRDELRAEQREIEAALEAELQTLSTEQRQILRQQELDELKKSLETQAAIRSKNLKKELLEQRKANEQFRAEEEKFGTTIAILKKFQRSEEFKNAQQAANALAQLQQSENSNLRAIGKAAALAQIAINTQKGAMAAYASVAQYGPAGQVLGIALAAALVAYGAERARGVLAAQTGGVVGGQGRGDITPALLEPGELITPRQNFEEVVNAVADKRAIAREAEAPAETGERTSAEILIGFDGEEAADILTVRQNEQSFLGTSQRITFVR